MGVYVVHLLGQRRPLAVSTMEDLLLCRLAHLEAIAAEKGEIRQLLVETRSSSPRQPERRLNVAGK